MEDFFNFLETNKDALGGLQALLASLAIAIGGVWFFVSRRRKPRGNFEHRVTHWRLNDGRMGLRVVIVVDNKGEVMMRLDSGWTSIQQVRPCSVEMLNPASEWAPMRSGHDEVEWPTIGFLHHDWKSQGREEVEPGERAESPCDFVLESDVEAVIVRSEVKNRTLWIQRLLNRKSESPLMWDFTRVYDVTAAESASKFKLYQ